MAVEDWGDPIVSIQHFACDLRITRLVGSHQADELQAKQEKESTKY